MKTKPKHYIKAEDVPAPSRAIFEGFLKQLVDIPKPELDRRETEYRKIRAKKK